MSKPHQPDMRGAAEMRAEPGRPNRGSPSRETTVALIGFGAINGRVAELLKARNAPVRIVAMGLRQRRAPPASLAGARILVDPDELASVEVEIVAEAAGRDAVLPWGEAALRAGRTFIVSSLSAFADDAAFARLSAVAAAHGGRLVLSHGAIAGVEAIAAASRAGLDRVVHRIIKPPTAWRGTPAEGLVDLAVLTQMTTFFSSSAREAAARFPANANVTIATALSAGLGLDATRVELVAAPGAAVNKHVIEASGAFDKLLVEIENKPLAANPKSSELAALALVRLIENAAHAVVI